MDLGWFWAGTKKKIALIMSNFWGQFFLCSCGYFFLETCKLHNTKGPCGLCRYIDFDVYGTWYKSLTTTYHPPWEQTLDEGVVALYCGTTGPELSSILLHTIQISEYNFLKLNCVIKRMVKFRLPYKYYTVRPCYKLSL